MAEAVPHPLGTGVWSSAAAAQELASDSSRIQVRAGMGREQQAAVTAAAEAVRISSGAASPAGLRSCDWRAAGAIGAGRAA